MANPIYAVKVLKVDEAAIDLELKAALDEHVYCWPSLAVRALADGPGSPLASFDLTTREGVAAAAEAWVERVDILATRKGLAQYRVIARKPGLGAGLKKAAGWSCSALHVDDPHHGPGVLAAGGKLAAVVVDPRSVVTCGAVELLGLTKKGPGATRGWLNHVGVRGVAAWADQILSWSPDRVRVWDDAGTLLAEREAAVTCACLTPDGAAIGTADGVLHGDDLLALGAVRALTWVKDRLHVLLASGEVVVLAGKLEERRIAAVPGTTLAVSSAAGDDLAISGDDGLVHWFRDGKPLGTVESKAYRGRTIFDTAALADGIAITGIDDIYTVHADGRVRDLGTFDASNISAAGGLVMATTHGEVVRARIWREDGACIGALAMPQSSLHRAQFPSRPHPVRLTWNGEWVLCAEMEHENGGVRLTGTRGQGQVRFANPQASYDFITDVEQVGPESFLIGYGNHDAVLWHLDGSHRTLDFRLDSIFYRDGLLLTSKDKKVTERSADLRSLRSFALDVPFGLHWLEASGDGRFVIAGAQPRVWIHDRKTGEQWEVVQDGGVNEPTFAGHPRYFTTGTMDSAGNVLRVWDAAEQRVVKQFPDERTTRRVVWQDEHTLMTAGYEGVFVTDLRGDRRAVLGPLGSVHVRDTQLSIGFDRKGRLLTMGERSHLYAWERPGQGKSRGGHFGHGIFEYAPGRSITLHPWPALPLYMPD